MLINVTKVDARLAQALFEKEQAIKALEKEKADRTVIEEAIRTKVLEEARREVVASNVDFGMRFKRFALFMI